MGIPRSRREIVDTFGKRRVQGLALAFVMAGGLGIAATSGAFASPSTQFMAASTTPVAAASGTPVPGSPGPGGFGPGPRGGPGRFGGAQVDSVATFLGISTTDLHTALASGQTLTQIAQAHGKSASDLKTYLLNQDSARIDKLISTNFQQVQAQHPGGPGGPFGADVATYLGISQATLQSALQSGQTLAQVAQAHGKSAADLTAYLTTQLKTHLDQAVAAGRITSQQETSDLAQASTRITQMINSTGPMHGPPPGAPGSAPSTTPTSAPTSTATPTG